MVIPIIEGFATKILTGLDDVLANAALLGVVAKNKSGKLAFIVGRTFMLFIIIGVSMFFADFINGFWWGRTLAALLLITLAIMTYFDVLVNLPSKACCEYIKCKMSVSKKSSVKNRVVTGFVAGFVAYGATSVDELIAYSSIMLKPVGLQLLVASGIIIAEVFALLLMFSFGSLVAKLPNKRIITSVGLALIAGFVFVGII